MIVGTNWLGKSSVSPKYVHVSHFRSAENEMKRKQKKMSKKEEQPGGGFVKDG